MPATTRTRKGDVQPGNRGASYARRSRDPNKIRASTKAQLERNRRAAQAAGITITAEYVDDDLPAGTVGNRPDFNDLVRAIEAGEADVVVAWEKQRLHRTLTEFETLTASAIRAGVRFLIDGRWFDPSDIDEWVLHGMGALLGAGEVKRIQKRFADGRLTAAEIGKPHGMVAYGYRRIWTIDDQSGERRYVREELEPDEAAVIKEAKNRLLAGESERSVCVDLTTRGIPTPRPPRWTPERLRRLVEERTDPTLARKVTRRLKAGETERTVARDLNEQKVPVPYPPEWNPTILRQILLRDRNVGDRTMHGTVMRTGAWPEVITRDELAALRALLGDPTRRTAVSTANRHLLSRIAICGICNQGVVTGKVVHKRKRTGETQTWRTYRCPTGQLVRKQEPIDEWVTAVTIALLESAEFAAALAARAAARPDTAALRAEVTRLRNLLDVAADQCARDEIDNVQLARITARRRPQLAAAERQLKEASRDNLTLLESVAGPDAAEMWAGLTLAKQRLVLASCWTIRLVPLGRGRWPVWPAPGEPMPGLEMLPRL